jgi:hypothetical protein
MVYLVSGSLDPAFILAVDTKVSDYANDLCPASTKDRGFFEAAIRAITDMNHTSKSQGDA